MTRHRSKSIAATRARAAAQPKPYGRVGEIFKRLWYVSVPMNATMNQTWLQTNGGRYTSGSKYWDQLMDNQQINTYITISKMVDYMREGVVIAIPRAEDTKAIYEVIQQYLLYASGMFARMYDPSVYSDTLEDLRDMDRLAGLVYKHARFHEPEIYTSNPFIQGLRGLSPWSAGKKAIEPARAIRRERTELGSMFVQMIDPSRLDPIEAPKDPFADMETV